MKPSGTSDVIMKWLAFAFMLWLTAGLTSWTLFGEEPSDIASVFAGVLALAVGPVAAVGPIKIYKRTDNVLWLALAFIFGVVGTLHSLYMVG